MVGIVVLAVAALTARHLGSAMRKLHVSCRTALAPRALQAGLIPPRLRRTSRWSRDQRPGYGWRAYFLGLPRNFLRYLPKCQSCPGERKLSCKQPLWSAAMNEPIDASQAAAGPEGREDPPPGPAPGSGDHPTAASRRAASTAEAAHSPAGTDLGTGPADDYEAL